METGSPREAGTAEPADTPDAGTREVNTPVTDIPDTPDTPGTRTVAGEPVWTGLPPGLLRMRRLLLVVWLGLFTLASGVVPALFAGPVWALCALPPLALLVWGWVMLGRNWRSWRYAERADDLLICRGVLWHEETVVPYGRMQLVEVTSGPVERHFGLASVQLHTAAAASDATIPGLDPAEAERLRDRLTELGEARSAGL
ncbi:PH domain-containing protein [Streptomyces tagetis]|uniref:PH domain-containing protein n=1 Tax=Streptomyces tagetis TaxID=2820809 RepID=A0A940XF52_9ACTN|nr:PH domain-containing protein [Streptomyces sp. RG38]MBQ0827295.1 PH domain-containing protein [Streptomyces sp. RG38]